MSKFDTSGDVVAEGLRAGLPLEVAADRAGVSASTVRGWLRNGARDPEGRFGEWARSARSTGRSGDGDDPMSVEELERHLTTVIREKQSVAAMKLWLDLHHAEGAGDNDDPLLDFVPRSHGGRG